MFSRPILLLYSLIFGTAVVLCSSSGGSVDFDAVCTDGEFTSYGNHEVVQVYDKCGNGCNATLSVTCQQCDQAHLEDCPNSCLDDIDDAVSNCLKCSTECEDATKEAIYVPCYWKMEIAGNSNQITVLQARLINASAETCLSANWGYIFALIFGAIGGSLIGTFLFATTAEKIAAFYSRHIGHYVSACCDQVSKWIPLGGDEGEEEGKHKD